MKLKYFMVGCVALSMVACGGKSDKTAEVEAEAVPADSAEIVLASVEQRLSYMVGDNIAQQFIRDDVEIDLAALTAGIEDAIAGQESRLSQEQVQATIETLQERAQKRQAEQQQLAAEAAEKNIVAGEAYLKENGAKEGVVTTESGLQY